MRLDRLHLRNFRCFTERDVEFAPRFNLIVGDNATGKTALLNGMAVGLGSLFLGFPSPASPKSIERDDARLAFYAHGDALTAEAQFPAAVQCRGQIGGEEGGWRRELTTEDGRTTRKGAEWIEDQAARLREQVKAGARVVLPVISFYGTGRLWVQKRQREVTTLRPESRFMGYLDGLDPASDEKRLLRWFKTQEIAAVQAEQPIGTLEACRRAMMACVPGANRVYFDVKRDQLIIELPGRSLPFTYLSDGYRNMVAMVADIAVRCATLNPHLREAALTDTPGVVLIDEIDLHLHPRWQRRVIGDLMSAFPQIQFIGSTHSPFVIQSLPPSGAVRLINLDDPQAADFVNKSVEDITEEVQGVELPQRSQRYLDMLKAAEEYYRVLSKVADASDEEKRRLSARLDELSLPFSDDPAYQAFLHLQRTVAGQNGEPS
ncbi:MAG TPA: AAA family ATPase [Pirellulales bacterium]|nr:AAA family ATPase [Pirellulales bacterium]